MTSTVRDEDKKDEENHRTSLLTILHEFRRSLKEEFPETFEKSQEPSTSGIRVSGDKHIAKNVKTRYRDENKHDLSNRGKPKHALSVLLDPRITNKGRTIPNISKHDQTGKSLKDQSSSRNVNVSDTDPTTSESKASNFVEEISKKTSIESAPTGSQQQRTSVQVTQDCPKHQPLLRNRSSTPAKSDLGTDDQLASRIPCKSNEVSQALHHSVTKNTGNHEKGQNDMVHRPGQLQILASSCTTGEPQSVTTDGYISPPTVNIPSAGAWKDATVKLEPEHRPPIVPSSSTDHAVIIVKPEPLITQPSDTDNTDIHVATESDNTSTSNNTYGKGNADLSVISESTNVRSEDIQANIHAADTSITQIPGFRSRIHQSSHTGPFNASFITRPRMSIHQDYTSQSNENWDRIIESEHVRKQPSNVNTIYNDHQHFENEPGSMSRERKEGSKKHSLDSGYVKDIHMSDKNQSSRLMHSITENNNRNESISKTGQQKILEILNGDPHILYGGKYTHAITPAALTELRIPNTVAANIVILKSSQCRNIQIFVNTKLDDNQSLTRHDLEDNTGAWYNEKAQAQARAEQRRNSDVHMKFGDDGLHIKTNYDDDSPLSQAQLMPPQQQLLTPTLQKVTPLYESQYDHYDGGGGRPVSEGEGYTANPYLSSYTTNLPEFSGKPVSSDAHRYPPDGRVFDSPRSGSNALTTHSDNNSLVHYTSPRDHMQSDLQNDPAQLDHANRRRRLGRDHTNYTLTPHFDVINDKKSKYEHSHGLTADGPPGLPLSGKESNYGEEAGLKLVVVDKTDDEDENASTFNDDGDDSSKYFQGSFAPRSNSDVFPIDRNAIDRDLYKQMYDPTADNAKSNRRRSLQTLSVPPSETNIFVVNDNRNNASSISLHEYDKHNGLSSKSDFVYHVTDYDSETAIDTGRTSSGPNRKLSSAQQFRSFDDPIVNNVIPYAQIPSRYDSSHTDLTRRASNISNPSQPIYTVSQVDYDRYTSNPSQLSTVRESSDRLPDIPAASHNHYGGHKDVTNRTFLVHQSPVGSTHSLKDIRNRDAKALEPGFKFQVNKYNLAKRTSILNRAEQLLDSRRGHVVDRSDSSDELERIDEDEDEDSDIVSDMTGPRHRALKHLQMRAYDESTSYNSSDDVLHNMRYHPRGPVSQAARRARLTSVNARLKKHKRIRAARRQIRAPPPITSDADSSDTDATEPPLSERHLNDAARYEDPINDSSRESLHNLRQGNSSPGPKGRRVLFFRNGDIHYKPRQVLISNKTYTNLEKLLVDMSSMVETSTGVKYIFSWPEGREIKSITEFENGKCYVCSSTNKLQRVDYGNSKENHWKGGKVDRNENFLFQQAAKVQSTLARPRILTVISNIYRESREKIILNTNSQMNFEDILSDISNMINVPNPPVTALYTEKQPHQKVESYSQLIRDFADQDTFIACGQELVPLAPRQPVQSSEKTRLKIGHKTNSVSDFARQPGPVSGSTARNHDEASDRIANGEQVKVWRRKTESIRVDINGKMRELFPPTQADDNDDGLKPDKKLKLDWVYGYRGRDVKQNLTVLSCSGELIYFVAAVGIVYNKKLSTQKHYMGHSEEITCLAVHPNGRFVATGQISGKTPETGAHVRIWDGISLSTYTVIGLGTFQQGVTCVNFSVTDLHVTNGAASTPGGLLMAIDDSDKHVMTVWEWQTEKLVTRTYTSSEPVISGCFYPFDESILVTYGKGHIHFWRMFWERGRKIMRDKLSGNFQDNVPKYVTSICFSPNGDVISGDSSGAILVWANDNNNVFAINGNISAQTRKAHKKSVSALCMLGDGTLLSGGGNVVKAWDSFNNYTLVKERILPQNVGHVRTIVPMNMTGLDGSIYVATTRNKVLEGSLQLKFKIIIQGHVEELWAIESHPLEETFVSAGHDQAVVKWSAVSHAPVWRVNVEHPCTSISVEPKGRLIALGTTSGKVMVLNSSNGVQLTTLMSGTVQINALSFSPDGKQLAVGTFDGIIQIFYVQDGGHNFFRPQTSVLKYNNMFIMHLDWSTDSKRIQAVMGDYEIVYWNITTMQRIKSSRSVRDVKWATHNCPIGPSIIGPWQNLDRGDVINVVSRSHNRDLQVVGDTKGTLRLYKWPSSVSKAGYRQTKVYSSNVTCASFTCDDGYLITSGGNDAALMQFSVLDTANVR